jgi:hypothetical protein
MEAQMFTAKKYRAKSKEYGDLVKGSDDPGQIRKLQDSKDSFSSLADNEEWLANNFDKMVQVPAEEKPGHITLVAEEERVLRCLGAAVIMQWNTLPAKLQRELFLTRPDRWASSWIRRRCEGRSPDFCISTKTTSRKRNIARLMAS